MFLIPARVRHATLGISTAVLVSAVAGVVFALTAPLGPDGAPIPWPVVAFEGVVAVAAALGIGVGLSRTHAGPGLALACIGGTIAAASFLGYRMGGRTLWGVSLAWGLYLRVLAAAALAALGALCVLTRDPRAWRTLGLAALLASPVLTLLLAALFPRGRALLSALLGTGPIQRTFVGLLGSVVLIALISASIHLGIRAFEYGRAPTSGGPPRPPRTDPTS